MKKYIKRALFVAFGTKMSTNELGSKLQQILEIKKILIINILNLVQGASYIYKYILAPCTKN